jgi:hypothetical protein
MIIKAGNKYRIVSSKGKNLGEYTSEKKAKDRLRQIEYFKNKAAGKFEEGGEVEPEEMMEENEEAMANASLTEKMSKVVKERDLDMVVGVIEILKKIEDADNREDILEDIIEEFKAEGIEFDYSVMEQEVMGEEEEPEEEEESKPLMVFITK